MIVISVLCIVSVEALTLLFDVKSVVLKLSIVALICGVAVETFTVVSKGDVFTSTRVVDAGLCSGVEISVAVKLVRPVTEKCKIRES